jgi:hypothetical protein
MDQVTSINQIMEQTAQKSEAALLRDLVDEALVARRRKVRTVESQEQLHVQGSAEILETIQRLLLRIIGQGERTLRAQGVSFMLTQETLAEVRAGRRLCWDALIVPEMRQDGASVDVIDESFERQTDESKEYAYSLAQEFTNAQGPRDSREIPAVTSDPD